MCSPPPYGGDARRERSAILNGAVLITATGILVPRPWDVFVHVAAELGVRAIALPQGRFDRCLQRLRTPISTMR